MSCAHCGGPVTLQLEDWPDPSPLPAAFADAVGYGPEWECPYCQRANSATTLGRLVWMTKRHGEERTQ